MIQRGDVVAGRFLLEREIAAGGMGRVFRAVDQVEGGVVAVKLLTSRGEDGGAARFLRECSILGRVGHPGIVRHVAHGIEGDGEPWLAMEWLEGEDLARLLGRRRGQSSSATIESDVQEQPGDSTMATPLSQASQATTTVVEVHRSLGVGEVVALLRRVAAALAVLHAEGIVHRDLKPGNLFLVGGSVEQAKMLDLGTARWTASVSDVTAPGVMVGTPAYMAPEQARAEAFLGTAVDLWALGCIAYEGLVGRAPFAGSHVLAIFARILVDEPAPLRVLRPEVPEELAALIDALLSKDPSRRPGCAEVLAALDRVAPGQPAAPGPARQVIGEGERRVRCVLLARGVRSDDASREALERSGARADRLAEGTLLVTVRSRLAPGDQALRAARAALALVEASPGSAVALATGRGDGQERGGVGELAAAAASALAGAAAGAIVLDAATAALLDGRFEVERGEGGELRLGALREAEQARTLLGRPTRTVGRRRELGMLQAIWDDCVEEPRSRPVLVTAGPGVGKSRLRGEFVRQIEGRAEGATVLLGQGDSLSAGSPYVMVAPALRRWAGIGEADLPEARRARLREALGRSMGGQVPGQVAEFLGELAGAAAPDGEASDALRAARGDPMLLAEQIGGAFVEWLRAETARGPVLFVIEDLHWGDRPSLRLLDAALRGLPEAPLMILVMARPEVHEVFPGLLAGHPMDEIRLEPLNRKASIELASAVLGVGASARQVEAIADRAAGNALFLEELIRAAAEGEGAEAPDTVIGMVQARLDALGPDARRLLRAASVFGEVFHEDGVRALVGAAGSGYDVGEWLDDLARRELVTAQARPASEPGGRRTFRFRHALVRDGAYATFTDGDRSLAHRLACGWLEENGERDALTLASHAERGGDLPRAARWLRRAAEQALEGNDLQGVIAAGERAIACGAEGADLGAVLALMATAAYWQSRYREAADHAARARALLPPAAPPWFVASGSALVSLARVGDFDAFDALFADVRAADAPPGALAAQLVALCRGTFQLIFKGRFADADATLARIDSIAKNADLDALTGAQISHVRGVRSAMVGDVGPFLVNLEAAVDLFERAGDIRNVSLERSTVGWCYAEIGLFDRAIAIVRGNLAHALRLRSQQAITYAKANLGYALERVPAHHAEARVVLGEAIAETHAVANRRLEGWSRGYLVPVLRAAGDHEAEEREAALACELLSGAPGLLAWTLAQRARALLALGRPADALPLARQAVELLDRLGGLLQGESLPPLALAEALEATSDPAARAAAADALARLRRRADRLPRDEWRRSFLAIHESQLTLDLARRLGLEP